MSDVIFYLVYPVLSTFIYISNLYILNDKFLKNKDFFQYTLLIYLLIVCAMNHSQLINILMVIFSLIFLKKKNYNILSFMLSYILMMLILLPTDALVGYIITDFFGIPYKVFQYNNHLRICAEVCIIITSTIFSFLLKRILLKFNFNFKSLYLNKITKKTIFSIILLFILLNIALRIFTLSAIDLIFDNHFSIYIACVIIILIFITIILYFLYKIVNIEIKKDYAEKENKQLKEYTDMLEKMSTDLRKFKHDYVNILYTLGDFINEGDINGLKNYYYKDLLPESKNIVKNDKHITLLKNIKITPLKALISSKLLAAQSEGIDINAEVLEEVDKLSIKTIDICRIIGIFLDNAAEAAMLCKKRFIHFAMIKTEENIIIVIINSCPDNVPPVFQLYQKNFSTKGTNRGIGLTSVKELIDTSYKNILLNTSVQNNIFKQELIIKNYNLE